jgi:hypothetical protein
MKQTGDNLFPFEKSIRILCSAAISCSFGCRTNIKEKRKSKTQHPCHAPEGDFFSLLKNEAKSVPRDVHTTKRQSVTLLSKE